MEDSVTVEMRSNWTSLGQVRYESTLIPGKVYIAPESFKEPRRLCARITAFVFWFIFSLVTLYLVNYCLCVADLKKFAFSERKVHVAVPDLVLLEKRLSAHGKAPTENSALFVLKNEGFSEEKGVIFYQGRISTPDERALYYSLLPRKDTELAYAKHFSILTSGKFTPDKEGILTFTTDEDDQKLFALKMEDGILRVCFHNGETADEIQVFYEEDIAQIIGHIDTTEFPYYASIKKYLEMRELLFDDLARKEYKIEASSTSMSVILLEDGNEVSRRKYRDFTAPIFRGERVMEELVIYPTILQCVRATRLLPELQGKLDLIDGGFLGEYKEFPICEDGEYLGLQVKNGDHFFPFARLLDQEAMFLPGLIVDASYESKDGILVTSKSGRKWKFTLSEDVTKAKTLSRLLPEHEIVCADDVQYVTRLAKMICQKHLPLLQVIKN